MEREAQTAQARKSAAAGQQGQKLSRSLLKEGEGEKGRNL